MPPRPPPRPTAARSWRPRSTPRSGGWACSGTRPARCSGSRRPTGRRCPTAAPDPAWTPGRRPAEDRSMSARTTPWPAGVPCWANLTVPDVAVATAFYEGVLGWTFEQSEVGYGGYAIAHVGPAAAAGIGPQQIEGMPPAWTLFFASHDV